MSISDFFKKLGAPLKNTRWSWGAIRPADEAVFLRVWQDRKIVRERVIYMMVTHHEKYANDEAALGYQERMQHVSKLRAGSRCYMVMCLAKNPNASPRKIRSFDHDRIFVGGSLVEHDGDTYVE